MRVSTSSELWTSIYYNLRDHFMDDPIWRERVRTDERFRGSWGSALVYVFREHGIHIIQDGGNGEWTHVDLPDGDELTELILRWS
jgi:hypothetical protein